MNVEQKSIPFLDSELSVREFSCSMNGKKPVKIDPYVNLYLNITDVCQANCEFCEFHKSSSRKFSVEKFKIVMKELKERKIPINKINFSGGEPTLELDLIEEVLSLIEDQVYITINTNGIYLNKISKSKLLEKISCVSLSRHHWKDKQNEEIFKSHQVAKYKDIKFFSDKSKLHLRCNLIKNYIFDDAMIRKYVEEMSNSGVYDFGFVSLMKINDYCNENFIDSSRLRFDFRSREISNQKRLGVCSCKNYLQYSSDGNLVKLYSRINNDVNFDANTLVIDLDTIKQGFNGRKFLC